MKFFFIVIMTLMGAMGKKNIKKAASSGEIRKIILNKFLYIGGIVYVLSALINIVILKYLDYSVVLPLTSLTYIWTMVFSYFLLKENISIKKIAGVALIIVGAILVAY